MASWIFQGNPSIFDLDGYLASTPGMITWTVKQHAKEIAEGDTVYLWRAQGKQAGEKRSGIIASATVASTVNVMLDEPAAAPFWIDSSALDEPLPRVWLRLERVANKKEELKREWLSDDPILREMGILRQPVGTNFRLTSAEADRLRKMWSRVGQDWNRAESIAGLWAYVETYGKEVSRSKDSPVGYASRITGRAVTGVYNKVMNYRAIDPRDERKGMSGAGKTDKAIWAEFFEPSSNELDTTAIQAEFARLWGETPDSPLSQIPDAAAESAALDNEVSKLLERNLSELMTAYAKQKKQSKTDLKNKPKAKISKTTQYERNPLVAAIGKKRADSRCESPDCRHELFEDNHGNRYCEVHHIHPLSDGGLDVIENVICLCPAHHKEAHFGKAALQLKEAFQAVRATDGGARL